MFWSKQIKNKTKTTCLGVNKKKVNKITCFEVNKLKIK